MNVKPQDLTLTYANVCYARITYKHGKNTARVAVAREMLKIIYSMLTHNRPFVKE